MHTETINGSWHLIDDDRCICCGKPDAEGIVATVAMPAMKRVLVSIHNKCLFRTLRKKGEDGLMRIARARANVALTEWHRIQQAANN